MKPRQRRTLQNLAIAAGSATGAGFFAWRAGSADTSFALSMGTAYMGLVLLGITLLLGPINILLSRQHPLSTHLRRDIGIWAALLSLAHVVVGLQRHMGGRWWEYFMFPKLQGRLWGLRHDAFGAGNWIGLLATLVLVTLLAISNDRSIRVLGASRWKRIQRWNYVLFPAVVVHAALYHVAVGGRAWFWVSAITIAATVVLSLQAVGFLSARKSEDHIHGMTGNKSTLRNKRRWLS